jgi:tryptophan 2,3-dioxygenase
VHYRDYLNLDTLLSLQHPRVPTGQPHRVWTAEHFFIVGHQCCELWLTQVLLDLDSATEALSPPDVAGEPALEYLSRTAKVLDVLYDHVGVLDHLPSHCFAQFRPYLGSASGAQSAQFHELDRRLGVVSSESPVERAFLGAVDASGLELIDVCRMNLDAGVLHRIFEALLDIAQGYWQWKIAHLALVSRLLGDIEGTAGTSGADYLARHVRLPFPGLRQVRRLADFPDPEEQSTKVVARQR